MADWHIASVEITGGFLPGLKLTIPVGLTCIIGPRGSGKSTFVEAIRFAVLGGDRSTRFQNELIKANLGNALILLRTDSPNGDRAYSIQRSLHDGVALSAADGRALPHVDLDRGTFLPLDAYSDSVRFTSAV